MRPQVKRRGVRGLETGRQMQVQLWNLRRQVLWGVVWLMAATAVAEPVDFSLPDLDGETHRLSDYRGRWVVVNYWATWCPPCLEELPELEVFHNAYSADKAVVLGVNMEDIDLTSLRRFVEEQFLSFPILVAGARPRELVGQVPGLPTTFLIDPQGNLVARQVGPVTAKALERYIENYEARQRPGGA
jgi:peroxiredoxin